MELYLTVLEAGKSADSLLSKDLPPVSWTAAFSPGARELSGVSYKDTYPICAGSTLMTLKHFPKVLSPTAITLVWF